MAGGRWLSKKELDVIIDRYTHRDDCHFSIDSRKDTKRLLDYIEGLQDMLLVQQERT